MTFVSLEGYPNCSDDLDAPLPDDCLTMPQAKCPVARMAPTKPKR